MRILGIDPGYAIVGFGVIEYESAKFTLVDMGVLVGGILLLWAFSYTKYTVARWEGALLTLLFCGYMGWLIYQVV